MRMLTELSTTELRREADAAFLEWRRAFRACAAARQSGDTDREIVEGVTFTRAARYLDAIGHETYIRQASAEGYRLVVSGED